LRLRIAFIVFTVRPRTRRRRIFHDNRQTEKRKRLVVDEEDPLELILLPTSTTARTV